MYLNTILNVNKMSNENEHCCQFCFPEHSYTCSSDISVCYFCFPTFNNFIDEGCEWCNQSPLAATHPCCGPAGGPQCISCYLCFSPIGGIIDIITFPFRSLVAVKKFCCHKK